ncbi:MAG: redox-sensing transcriptional repressor Rex [Chitinivibrionales bacterium]|nr:redox-sensing transcriptional repressor Rex [Chitinivibrionales bacterium]
MHDRESINMRLLEYKNILKKLKGLGFSRVFSSNLADSLGISASLVRKDFSVLDTAGNKRGGYQIDELLDEIHHMVRRTEVTRAVIAGVGKIGSALLNYQGFHEENIRFEAAFEIDPSKIDPDAPVPVFHIDEITTFIPRNGIEIAVLAVPGAVVQRVADLMVLSGVKGFLNFAPVRLVLPKSCYQNHINLALELEKVIFQVASTGLTDTDSTAHDTTTTLDTNTVGADQD